MIRETKFAKICLHFFFHSERSSRKHARYTRLFCRSTFSTISSKGKFEILCHVKINVNT